MEVVVLVTVWVVDVVGLVPVVEVVVVGPTDVVGELVRVHDWVVRVVVGLRKGFDEVVRAVEVLRQLTAVGVVDGVLK